MALLLLLLFFLNVPYPCTATPERLMRDMQALSTAKHLIVMAVLNCSEKVPCLPNHADNRTSNQEDILDRVARVLASTAEQCRRVMHNKRWNCDVTSDTLQKTMNELHREASFLQTVLAAELTQHMLHTVAPCASCERSERRVLQRLGTCIRRSIRAVTLTSFSRRVQRRIVRNNAYVGVRIALNMSRGAVCPPTSSDRPVPDLGSQLTQLYSTAVRARIVNGKLVGLRGEQVASSNMLYSQSSPDYCAPMSRQGVAGTQGRECLLSDQNEAGCMLLCCGRGYHTSRVTSCLDQDCSRYKYHCR